MEPGEDHTAPGQDSHLEQGRDLSPGLPCVGGCRQARRSQRSRVERERSSRTTAPGSRCFGGSSGRPEFILAKLEAKSRQHNVLLDRITAVGVSVSFIVLQPGSIFAAAVSYFGALR